MGSIYGYPEAEGPRKKAKFEQDESCTSESNSVSLPVPPLPRVAGPGACAQSQPSGHLVIGTSPEQLHTALENISNLKGFLVTAPATFKPGDIIHRFPLPTTDEVSCVRWNNIFYMTGTDIVRCLTYRFLAFGRSITNKKKFEEGVFSDLRNLKNNMDATLESPRSEFLEFLYKNRCVRTKKKQKVFFWYSVHHERLFIDALERDLRKECGKSNEAATTNAICEPALSFKFDPNRSLKDQISGVLGTLPTPLAAIAKATFTGNTQQTPYAPGGAPPAPVALVGSMQGPGAQLPPHGPPGLAVPGSMPSSLQVPPGPGGHNKRNLKLPPTPVFGTYPPAHELDDGLDVDFFKDSDFPLDLLRKEDMKAGNTPTTAHFPGYVEELYDYGRDQRPQHPQHQAQQQQQQYMVHPSQIPPYEYNRGYMVQAPPQQQPSGTPSAQPGQPGQPQQAQPQQPQTQTAQTPQTSQTPQAPQGQYAQQYAQQPGQQAMYATQQQMMQMQMQSQYPYIMVPYTVPQGGNN